MKKRREEMLTAPVEKIICRMALPTILGMLVTAVYSMTDTFFVGLLKNTTLTAAVGIVFYFMSLVQAAGFLFGYGSGNYIARCIGRNEEESAKKMAATGLVFSIGAGVLIMGAGYLFLPGLIHVLGGGASTELMKAAREMMQVFLIGVPGMTGAFCLYNQLRLEGNAGRAILGMGTGMLLNIILDPVFILGMKMGVSGAALATVIGQYVGLAVLWLISFCGECISVRLPHCVLEKDILKELFLGGTPNFLRQSITTISGICLNHAAGFYGDSAIAAFTVSNRILSMLIAGVIGFGQGYQSVCAVNFGAGKQNRVKRGFDFCVRVSTIVLLIVAAGTAVFAPELVHIFTKEEAVCSLGIKILRWQCVAIPFMGYTTIVGMFLQNIGQFGKAAVVTSLRQGILFLPFLIVLPVFLGMEGVVAAQPLADLFAFPVAFLIGTRQMKNLVKDEKKEWKKTA